MSRPFSCAWRRATPAVALGAVWACLFAGPLACSVDSLSFVGRPCSEQLPCRGGTVCDPSANVCIATADGGVGPDADAGLGTTSGGLVNASGWGWRHPLPQGNDLLAVWASADGKRWLVGAGGTIIHHDGKAFSAQSSGTREPLRAVHGSAGEVWAVGGASGQSRVATRWDGNGWRATSTPGDDRLNGVWVRAASDVWAVGNGGQIAHFDGTSWTSSTPGPLRDLTAVSGRADNDVWAAGDRVALHYDGKRWTDDGQHRGNYLALRLEPTGDLWLAGANGDLSRSTATDGVGVVEVGSEVTLRGLAAATAGEVWAVGGDAAPLVLRCDRLACSPWALADAGSLLRGVWAADVDEAWAVGDHGTIVRFDGGAWSPLSSAIASARLSSSWAFAADDVWAVGDGGLALHFDGQHWSMVETPTEANLNGLWGATPDDLWAIGDGGTLLHYDGLRWSVGGPTGGGNLYAIWGSARDDIWVMGEGLSFKLALRYDGSSWRSHRLDFNAPTARALWGSDRDHVWAVGGNAILSYRNGRWSQVNHGLPNLQLTAIWGSSSSDIWAAGEDGKLFHHDGTQWAEHGQSSDGPLRALWGLAADAVWAVGDNGFIVHYDGSTWREETSGAVAGLRAIGGTGPTDVWAVGELATILHFDDR